MGIISASFFMLLLSAPLLAQTNLNVGSFVDVLTHPDLQNNIELARETSNLETQEIQNRQSIDCATPVHDPDNSCEGYLSKLLPKHLKESGWQVLFEAKYKPISERSDKAKLRSTGSQTFDFNTNRVENYYNANPVEDLNFANEAELRAEAQKISSTFAGTSPDEFYGPLVLQQIQKSQNHDEMMNRFKNLTGGMSDQAFTNLMTHFAGWADYNDERAAFSQTEGAGLGKVSPLGIITQTESGVCGDIHSMVAKFAEQRGWEAFTVGYANDGNQHVVTAMVNPNQPNKLMVVNYGRYEEHSLNSSNSVLPAPTSPDSPGFAELGMQLRIFKNTGGDGEMQQIATIPTPLGSMMRSLFNRKDQHSRVIPENESFTLVKAQARHQNYSTNINEDGDLRERSVAQGIMVYEGETDNAQVYGVAVSRDVFNHLYKFDPELKKCIKKRSRYFSLGVAGNLIDLPNSALNDTFYVYLNMRGGQVFHLYQTEFFQFKGLIGYELEGFMALTGEGNFLSADGNLTTFAGLMADYQKDGNTLYGGLRLETNVALKDQNLMTDLSALPRNINPVNFNALAIDLGGSARLSENLVLRTDNNYVLSRVGSKVMLSTSLIHHNTTYSLSYQGKGGAIPLGNSLRHVNLLQNTNGYDGYKFSVGQNFQTRSIAGSVSGYVGRTAGLEQEKMFFGGSLKINFRPRRR